MTTHVQSAPALAFHETTFHPVTRDGQPWLTAAEISAALGYARTDKVSQIYSRHQDEFTAAWPETSLGCNLLAGLESRCKEAVRIQ